MTNHREVAYAIISGEGAVAAHNTQYALVNFVLLWLSDLNRYSIDGLRRRGKS